MDTISAADQRQSGDAVKLVPAVERAVRILNLVCGHVNGSHGLKLADIIRQSRLPKSSVHGLCQTLVQLDLLQYGPDGIYSIGPASLRWSNAFLDNNNIVSVFQRALAAAPALHPYTVTLSRLEQDEVVYVAFRNASTPFGITFRIGMRLPALFTATGKAMLATMAERDIDKHLPAIWPQPLTPTGIADRQALDEEINIIRTRGYSLDNGQLREGMYCIGAALADRAGVPVAGVAVTMTEAEARPEKIAEAGAQIIALTEAIRSGLGWN